jgi:hypothetical protein
VRLPNQLLIRGDVMAILREERAGRPRLCLCPGLVQPNPAPAGTVSLLAARCPHV